MFQNPDLLNVSVVVIFLSRTIVLVSKVECQQKYSTFKFGLIVLGIYCLAIHIVSRYWDRFSGMFCVGYHFVESVLGVRRVNRP